LARHHLLATDSVFRETEDGNVGFDALPRPRRKELQAMVERLARRRRGCLPRQGPVPPEDLGDGGADSARITCEL